jgi:hypothetical protein
MRGQGESFAHPLRKKPMIPLEDRETALVIDHHAEVFHISSSMVAMMTALRKFAKQHKLPIDSPNDDESVSLSSVPIELLKHLKLATVANCSRS